MRPYQGRLLASAELRESLQTRRPEWVAKLSADDLRFVVDLYDASIRDVDRYLGRLVSRLEALGEETRWLGGKAARAAKRAAERAVDFVASPMKK